MSQDGSTRSRLCLSALLFYAGISLAAVGGTIAATILAGRHPDPAFAWLLKCVLVLALVGALTWTWMRRAGVSWRQYGLTATAVPVRRALAGFLWGLALAGAWAAIVWLWSPYALHPNPTFSLRALALGTCATLAIGIAEEIGYRTYGLSLLEACLGPLAAVLLPSAIFAAMHTTGGMPWLAALCVVGSCGVLYGMLMLATRSLPFVAAFHIANNVLQDAVIRTGDGSPFAPTFAAKGAGLGDRAVPIWLCILAVNLAIAALVWRKRRKAP